MKNKKGNLISDEPILWIIAIIVFVIVSFFIINADFLSLIKNFLPNLGGESNSSSSVGFSEFNPRNNIELLSIINSFNKYSPEKEICDCGNLCEDYSKWIVKYSKEVNLPDPLMLLSLMIQESNCKKDASSGSSYGLMQLRADSFDYCKEYNLPSDIKDVRSCQRYLINNPEENIRIGAEILKKKYETFFKGVKESSAYKKDVRFKKIVDNCIEEYPKYEKYRFWSAAFRGYNGWACNKGANLNFVEEITERFNILSSFQGVNSNE